MNVPHKRHVLVEVIMPWQVALRDGVRTAGLVLVDHAVHVGAEKVLGVLVDVLLVHLLAEDGHPTARAAADAAAEEDLEDRDDHQHEAPTADVLASHPRPEEASHEAVDECADAADAGAALDARETPSADAARLLRLRVVPLRMLLSSSAS